VYLASLWISRALLRIYRALLQIRRVLLYIFFIFSYVERILTEPVPFVTGLQGMGWLRLVGWIKL